jgi:hypothetical protein
MGEKVMADALSPSHLAAKLVVEGSLDVIAAKPGAQFPMPGGLALSKARRAELGRPPGGGTVFYAIEPGQVAEQNGVFVDFQDSATTIWFNGPDSKAALAVLEKAIKSAYPKIKQQSDKPHPTEQGLRQRSYDIVLSKERAVVLDVAYPANSKKAERFVVRIAAFAKPDKRRH